MVQKTFVSSLKKFAPINYWYFVLKVEICLTYRLQGVKLGLKSVIYLCRIYLSIFHQQKFFVLSAEFFSVLTHEFNMPFVRHGGTKTQMAVIQRHSAFPLEKSYLLKLTNVSGTSLLILLH